jgi:hypothetical protein
MSTEEEDFSNINIKRPTNYDADIPIVNKLAHLKDYERCDYWSIERHFENLKETRIRMIYNETHDFFGNSMTCDYCNVDFIDDYHRCTTCHKNMCDLCFNERTDAVKCFEHELQRKVNKRDAYCNECGKYSMEARGVWRSNIKEDIDYCSDCSKGKDTTGFIDIDYDEENEFGSLFDWIPVISSYEENHAILYCINKDSAFYHTTATMTMDDHGRVGFSPLEMTLEETLAAVDELGKGFDYAARDWEHHYNYPICKLAKDKNIRVYFG